MAVPTGTSKADVGSVIENTLGPRLKALGIGVFTISAGDAITVQLARPSSISETLLDQVVHARGDVSFVGLPKARFGDGSAPKAVPAVGDPLDPGVTVSLANRTDIASGTLRTDVSNGSAVEMTFTADAERRIAEYTAGHVGEFGAILIDGQVFAVPVIQAPIHGGMVVTGGSDADPRLLVAVLAADPLPAAFARGG